MTQELAKLPERYLVVDFANCSIKGDARLNCNGTFESLKKWKIELREGLEIVISDEQEFVLNAVVRWCDVDGGWVAKFDWDELMNSPRLC